MVAMQSATSDFAFCGLAEPSEDETGGDDSVLPREPLAPIGSQMTVPETPSPDVLELK